MKPEIHRFDIRAQPELIEAAEAQAIKTLGRGGHVVVPTGRWYMICCDASRSEATAQIFRAKQRKLSAVLLTVVPDRHAAGDYFQISRHARRLIDTLWPCGLVLRLPWNAEVAEEYSAGSTDWALACAPGSFLNRLSRQLGRPLTATSVNISDPGALKPTPPAITPEAVEAFISKSGLSDVCQILGGIQSEFAHLTMISCLTDTECDLVRPGVVDVRALEAAVGIAKSVLTFSHQE